jgi:hypothetical protein
MSADTFTETSSQNVFERLGNSFKNIIVGIVLFIVSFPVLWLNEGRAVDRARTLAQGADAVVAVTADEVNQDNEGSLVHVSGLATTLETLSDPDFNISAAAIKLIRRVEMFQWVEDTEETTKKKVGGGTETKTTYRYSKAWMPHVVDSSEFAHPQEHGNPGAMVYEPELQTATLVTLGAFRLPPGSVGRISGEKALPATDEALAKLPAEARGKMQRTGASIYYGSDPGTATVGDLKISFSTVPPGVVSLVAKQSGETFEPYRFKKGSIDLFQMGEASPESMFATAVSANRALTWILRFVGFIVMAVGIGLVLGPLGVIADVIPFIGSIVRAGTGIVAALLAFMISMTTIAVAWLVYRPLLGILLLAIAGLGFFALRALSKDKAPPVAPVNIPPQAPPPPPPGS